MNVYKRDIDKHALPKLMSVAIHRPKIKKILQMNQKKSFIIEASVTTLMRNMTGSLFNEMVILLLKVRAKVINYTYSTCRIISRILALKQKDCTSN